ncbi:MAG TPA: peroxide stress protein YaaA [Acidimicrobiales bacterium]|nr:peroxide stress protein YaaA [Acidimicrobiales bacterium]
MTHPRPVLLLPPSEGKAEGGHDIWDASAGAYGALERPRRTVARRLAAAMSLDPSRLTKLLGVKGEALERAVRANRRLIRRPLALPSAERFTGVVHDHFGLAGMPRAARRRAESDVVFLSALGGVVAPGDPLPDHRAKMSISLEPLGKLSTWWRPQIDEVLGSRLGGSVVVDLLPKEHAAALTPFPDRWARWIQVRFETEAADGSRRTVGHEAKAGKGLFARHLVEAGSADDDTIQAFATDDGWSVEAIDEPADPADGPIVVTVVRRDRPSS